MAYQDPNNGPLTPINEETDMLHYVTTLEPKTPTNKGSVDKEILDKWDSMASPNISFSNYKEEGIISQMWMASFIADRVLNSYTEEEYDPLVLAKIKAVQANIYAKLNLGKEGSHNILKTIKSIWSHAETVTSSRHDENIRTKGIKLDRKGR